MRFVGIMMFAVAALSCAPGLAQTLPGSVSSSTYREFTCLQLAQEGRAISKRGFVASGLKAGQGGSDATDTAAAVVIVWPAASHVGDKPRPAQQALRNN